MEIKEKKVMIKGEFPIAATVTYTDKDLIPSFSRCIHDICISGSIS